jgi:hypothetical protein
MLSHPSKQANEGHIREPYGQICGAHMGFTWYMLMGSERVSDGLTHGLNRGCTASAPYV